MYRIFFALLFVTRAICAEPTHSAEANGLKLEVSYTIVEQDLPPSLDPAAPKKKPQYQIELTCILKNTSDHSISVPTNTYDGRPSAYGGNPGAELYAFFGIGPVLINDQLLQPSPYRYFPVTLKPGESTALPDFSIESTERERPVISNVLIIYHVDLEYAARQGWWGGELRWEKLGEKKPRPHHTAEPVSPSRAGSP